MVFSRLAPADKDAFFALLDELSAVSSGPAMPSVSLKLLHCAARWARWR